MESLYLEQLYAKLPSMSMIRNRRDGFTIVELLIVIVVIAILAAITVVAYNGIQQRANNVKTISVVESYYKALIQYATINGQYPNGTASSCLGEGYSCYAGVQDTTFNDNIRMFLGNANPLPTPTTIAYSYYGSRAGAAFSYMSTATLDGVSYPWGLTYLLGGSVNCGLSGVAGVSGGWPNFTRTPNTSGASERNSGNSLCRLILPDPATL